MIPPRQRTNSSSGGTTAPPLSLGQGAPKPTRKPSEAQAANELANVNSTVNAFSGGWGRKSYSWMSTGDVPASGGAGTQTPPSPSRTKKKRPATLSVVTDTLKTVANAATGPIQATPQNGTLPPMPADVIRTSGVGNDSFLPSPAPSTSPPGPQHRELVIPNDDGLSLNEQTVRETETRFSCGGAAEQSAADTDTSTSGNLPLAGQKRRCETSETLDERPPKRVETAPPASSDGPSDSMNGANEQTSRRSLSDVTVTSPAVRDFPAGVQNLPPLTTPSNVPTPSSALPATRRADASAPMNILESTRASFTPVASPAPMSPQIALSPNNVAAPPSPRQATGQLHVQPPLSTGLLTKLKLFLENSTQSGTIPLADQEKFRLGLLYDAVRMNDWFYLLLHQVSSCQHVTPNLLMKYVGITSSHSHGLQAVQSTFESSQLSPSYLNFVMQFPYELHSLRTKDAIIADGLHRVRYFLQEGFLKLVNLRHICLSKRYKCTESDLLGCLEPKSQILSRLAAMRINSEVERLTLLGSESIGRVVVRTPSQNVTSRMPGTLPGNRFFDTARAPNSVVQYAGPSPNIHNPINSQQNRVVSRPHLQYTFQQSQRSPQQLQFASQHQQPQLSQQQVQQQQYHQHPQSGPPTYSFHGNTLYMPPGHPNHMAHPIQNVGPPSQLNHSVRRPSQPHPFNAGAMAGQSQQVQPLVSPYQRQMPQLPALPENLLQLHLQSPELTPSPTPLAANHPDALHLTVTEFPVSRLEVKSLCGKHKWIVSEENYGHLSLTHPTAESGGIRKRPMVKPSSLIYRLRCVEVKERTKVPSTDGEWVVKETCWPPNLFIEINGHRLDLRRKAQWGKDMPADITNLICLDENELKIFQLSDSGAQNRHFVSVELFKCDSEGAIKAQLLKNQYIDAERSKAAIIGRLSPDEGSDEIMVSSTTIGITCPLSFQLITLPVRGRSCRHLECFDFDNFMGSRPRKRPGDPPAWDGYKCPLCGGDARPQELVVDGFLHQVLRKLKEEKAEKGVKGIMMSDTGEYEVKREIVDDEEEMEDGEKEVEVICLDDD